MIAWLNGILIEKNSSQIVIDVNGVGYDVAISMTTFFSLPNEGEPYACFVQTIVREDAFSLFGFSKKQERALFRILIKVSGIGPKVALGILSSASTDEFVRIIKNKELKSLIKLPGIGKKTAERLMIELSDKLSDFVSSESYSGSINKESPDNFSLAKEEACQALVSLGYMEKHAEKVMNQLDDGTKSVDDLIRLGLKELSPIR